MKGRTYDRLTMLDSSFLAMEDGKTHMHVASITIHEAGPLRRPDGGIDGDRIRNYVRSRLHLIPRYRQRLNSLQCIGDRSRCSAND